MIDWSAVTLAAIIFMVFLFLTNRAGKSFNTHASRLRVASETLREERHRMIDERHHRDEYGNYVHGDPVWKEPISKLLENIKE